MIGLPSGTRIYLCTEPVDFRKGFDGLTGIVTTALGQQRHRRIVVPVRQSQARSHQSPVVGDRRTDAVVSTTRTRHRRIAQAR